MREIWENCNTTSTMVSQLKNKEMQPLTKPNELT